MCIIWKNILYQLQIFFFIYAIILFIDQWILELFNTFYEIIIYTCIYIRGKKVLNFLLFFIFHYAVKFILLYFMYVFLLQVLTILFFVYYHVFVEIYHWQTLPHKKYHLFAIIIVIQLAIIIIIYQFILFINILLQIVILLYLFYYFVTVVNL